MSGYLGSWKIDDLLTFYVVTQVFATGVATDADAVPAYRVYEDETATPILTGNMALLDAANTAGLYSEQITLSAANGFEKGKSYSIHIAATVSSVAGATVRTFQIQAEVAVASIAANAITATSIASDAITAAKVADGTIDAATFAAGAINAAAIADGAIDAATFAANAITAAALATDAVAEIADGVWDEALAGHAVAGSAGAALTAAGAAGDPWSTLIPGAYGAGTAGFILGTNVNATVSSRASQTSVDDIPTNAELATALGTADDATLAAIAAVQADTDNIQTRLPAALVGGRIDASVGAMAAGTITAAAVATGAIDADALSADANAEIADAVWDELMAGHVISGSSGEFMANMPTAAQIVSGLLASEITELIAVPGASPQLEEAIAFLYMAVRNARHTTAIADEIHNSGGTVIGTATLSDDTTTFIKGKYA